MVAGWLAARSKADQLTWPQLCMAAEPLLEAMLHRVPTGTSRGLASVYQGQHLPALHATQGRECRCDGSDPAAVGETLANMDALERMFELSRLELSVMSSR